MHCTDYQSVLIICHLKKLGIDITCAFAFCTEVELVIAAIRTCNCSRHTIQNSPYYYAITASSTDNAAVDNIYNAVRIKKWRQWRKLLSLVGASSVHFGDGCCSLDHKNGMWKKIIMKMHVQRVGVDKQSVTKASKTNDSRKLWSCTVHMSTGNSYQISVGNELHGYPPTWVNVVSCHKLTLATHFYISPGWQFSTLH